MALRTEFYIEEYQEVDWNDIKIHQPVFDVRFFEATGRIWTNSINKSMLMTLLHIAHLCQQFHASAPKPPII